MEGCNFAPAAYKLPGMLWRCVVLAQPQHHYRPAGHFLHVRPRFYNGSAAAARGAEFAAFGVRTLPPFASPRRSPLRLTAKWPPGNGQRVQRGLSHSAAAIILAWRLRGTPTSAVRQSPVAATRRCEAPRLTNRFPVVEPVTSISHLTPHPKVVAYTSGFRACEAAAPSASAGAGSTGGSLAEVQVQRLIKWAKSAKCLIAESEFEALPLVSDEQASTRCVFATSDHYALKRTWTGTFGMVPRWQDGCWKPASATASITCVTLCPAQSHL
ncbi:MAG: hypothetical protein IPK32_16835 [Verrucomicrobiaceae bacterium]|nr:hypothetical protein [Verrucomicrobiaceae bacterium]